MVRGRAQSWRWLSRAVFSALIGGALLGCGQQNSLERRFIVTDSEAVDSPLGSYLAGRYARSARDTKSAADFFTAALAEDPENSALQQRTFLLLLADGRIEEALDIAHGLLAEEDTSSMAEILLAVEAVREGRYIDAATQLGEPPKRGFGALLTPLILAWSAAGEGQQGAALAMLEELSDREAFTAFRNYHSALILDFLDDAEGARKAYARFREEHGVSTSSALAYGSFLRRQGEAEAAEAVYDELLERSPDNPGVVRAMSGLRAGEPAAPFIASASHGVAEALYSAAGALARERGGDAARIYVHLALYLWPDFDPARMLLGEILDRDRRWVEAIAVYRSVPKTSPYYWEAQVRVAANLDRLERLDEAVEVLNAMAQQQPEDTVAIISLGDLLRAHKRYAEAAEAYDRALSRVAEPEERHWPLFYARGVALERSEEWARAEADFLRALELHPNQPLVLNYLGYSWVEQGQHLDRALKMIEKAVEQRPNDGYIVDSLGWVLYQLKDFEGAVAQLERAVELKPQDPVINDHLGDAYWQVGRRLEARFQWRHALSLEPEESEIPKIKAKLEKGLTSVASNEGGG